MYHIMTNEPTDESRHEININELKLQNNIIECPICLENIQDNNDILIMECCKYKIHIICLVTWYTNNQDNLVCVMCKQNNSFCNNLIDTDLIIQEHDLIIQEPEIINTSFQSIYIQIKSIATSIQSIIDNPIIILRFIYFMVILLVILILFIVIYITSY